MPVVTNRTVSLSADFDGVEVACQLRDVTRTRPFYDIGESLTMACGDDYTAPADSVTTGSLSGTVQADWSAAGISTLLEQALGQTIPIVWTETVTTADAGTTYTLTWTGEGFVRPISREWRAKGVDYHNVDIVLTSETSWTRAEA